MFKFSLFNIEKLLIKLGLRKPQSVGIKIENSRGVSMERNKIKGFDTGIAVKKSEDVKSKENEVVR